MNNVDTRFITQVEQEVTAIYLRLFPEADSGFVPRVFSWMRTCFCGGYSDYQPIDARYHDFQHSLQGTLCLARLLEGRHHAGAAPPVNLKMFELVLLAILFHDTGYLKKKADTQGTGAKYTATHVKRSAEFAREFLAKQGYSPTDILAVQNMIRCTGLQADFSTIPFRSELEQVLGFALGTADLLGQMAAADYIDKLEVLYQEFAEAVQFDRGKATRYATYRSARDLMRRTPEFWHDFVLPRINTDFGKLYRFLSNPYPDGPNAYLQRIEENLDRLQKKLAGSQE